MSLLKGKKGLIMGVANERSIAWGISQKLAGAGADLAFTYLGDALKKRVIPLAKSLNSDFTLSCNVESKEEIIKLFEEGKHADLPDPLLLVKSRPILKNLLILFFAQNCKFAILRAN